MKIEKAYYLPGTNTISIVLYNDSNTSDAFYLAGDRISSLKLTKQYGDITVEYDCYAIVDINEMIPNSLATLIINLDSIAESDGYTFDIAGTTGILIGWTETEQLSRVIYDEKQFYRYKLAIIDSGYSRGGDIRSAKKLARFSFYEQMLNEAAEMGLDEDAAIYIAEMLRMATYGIPYVKKDTCYI